MKSFFLYFLLLSFTVGIASCDDDDDVVDIPQTDSRIVGDWNLTDADIFTLDFKGDGDDRIGHRVEYHMTNPGDYVLTFGNQPQKATATGSATFKRIESNDRGDHSETMETLNDFLDLGDWKLDGDRLTITESDGDATTYYIYELNDRKLVFGYNFENDWKPVEGESHRRVKYVFLR